MVMHKPIDALGVAVLAALHETADKTGLRAGDVGGAALAELTHAILGGLAAHRFELVQQPARLMDNWTFEILTDTFGVTAPALTALRNQLGQRIDHRVEIALVPAEEPGDGGGYGLAIVDLSLEQVVIIGDGFTGNGGGEGGAGHFAAQALLGIYGISQLQIHHPVESIVFGPETDWIAVAGAIVRGVGCQVGYPECDRFRPSLADTSAGYIRHLVGRGRA